MEVERFKFRPSASHKHNNYCGCLTPRRHAATHRRLLSSRRWLQFHNCSPRILEWINPWIAVPTTPPPPLVLLLTTQLNSDSHSHTLMSECGSR